MPLTVKTFSEPTEEQRVVVRAGGKLRTGLGMKAKKRKGCVRQRVHVCAQESLSGGVCVCGVHASQSDTSVAAVKAISYPL